MKKKTLRLVINSVVYNKTSHCWYNSVGPFRWYNLTAKRWDREQVHQTYERDYKSYEDSN